jgi:general secretion pathway protein L
MNLISVDIGTYSIKILVSKYERGQYTHTQNLEIKLDYNDLDQENNYPLWDLQMRTLSDFTSEIKGEYRLILNAPMDILTFRRVELPIGQYKKAQLMLPFKLEEDIPFTIAESHYDAVIHSEKNSSDCFAAISMASNYEGFYNKLNQYEIAPRIVTCEASSFSQAFRFIPEHSSPNFAIIDIGHKTTHGYLFFNNKLVDIHTSFIAGEEFDEMISENYQLSLEEASKYKEENSFFLTEDQLEEVDEKQKNFAMLMSATIKPLIQEMKRWDVGFRVNHGLNIQEVYITGGMSKTTNIAPYLAQELGLTIRSLDSFALQNTGTLSQLEEDRMSFNTVNTISRSFAHKKDIINLNKSPYSIGVLSDLPVREIGFVAVRMAMLTMLFAFFMIIEKVMLYRDLSTVDRVLAGVVKNEILSLRPAQRRTALLAPERTTAQLKRRMRTINQSVKTIQSAVDYNTMDPLLKFLSWNIDEKTYLESFDSLNYGEFTANFKSDDLEKLRALEASANQIESKNISTNIDETALMLTITGMN